jgi:uncharacterized protein (TIGR02118 family)
MVKAISLIRRKSGLSREDFHRYWWDVHGTIAARIPGLRRYVQCHAMARDGGDAASERRLIDLEQTMMIFTEEVPVLA